MTSAVDHQGRDLPRYDERFYHDGMRQAIRTATMSIDLRTQTGAVLAHGPFDSLRPNACNKAPEGVRMDQTRAVAPHKYLFTEHCERGAIYHAARRRWLTDGSVMFVAALFGSCADCARAIIGAGVRELVRLDYAGHEIAHWNESVDAGDTMLREAGVRVKYLPWGDYGFTLRHNGGEVSL